nr:glycosyl transferase [Sphingorhabdus sp.]
TKDLVELQRSTDLFARKFDAEQNTEILSLLELHLRSPAANIYRAPNAGAKSSSTADSPERISV